MKLHVVSDGTTTGTRITSAETGQELPATAIRFEIAKGLSAIYAEVTLYASVEHVDITADFDVEEKSDESLNLLPLTA